MAFTGILNRFTIWYDRLLLKGHVQELKEVNGWNVTVWSITIKVH